MCAFYEPPTQNLAIFDADVFTQNDEPLTITSGSKYFLRFPNAQGEENLQAVNVNGVLTANSSTDLNGQLFVAGTSSFEDTITLTSTTANNRRVYSSHYNLTDVNGNVNRTSEIFQNSQILTLDNEATNGRTRFINSTAAGVPTTTFEIDTTNSTMYVPLNITSNSNLTMNSGTGFINQPSVLGDISTKNSFKLSGFQFGSNNTNGTPTAFDFFDNVNGKGLFLIPNSDNGSFGSTNRRNDCCLTSRNPENTNAITISNWNSNMRNGLRVFTTDVSNCGLTLQCGQNTTSDWTQFAMNYDRSFNLTTTSFNNVINFNPATGTGLPNAISSARRKLEGLGTLSFTDISGNNTTDGSAVSRIWTDSSLVNSLNGMYYDCGINGGYHQFSARDSGGNVSTPIYYGSNITSVSNTFIVRNATTPSNRLDFSVDTAQTALLRMRSTTAGTNASINITCDTVSAGGVVTSLSNCVMAPFTFEMRRAVQFNYLTTPFNTSQLGFITGPTAMTTGSSIASSASERNFGSFTLGFAGAYSVKVLIAMAGSANHTLTECRWCLDGTSATFPSISTPTRYTPSITGIVGASLSSTYTSYMNINLDIVSTVANQIIYVNYVLNYSGGSTTTLNATYSYIRIG